jgi:hypothetical protein
MGDIKRLEYGWRKHVCIPEAAADVALSPDALSHYPLALMKYPGAIRKPVLAVITALI